MRPVEAALAGVALLLWGCTAQGGGTQTAASARSEPQQCFYTTQVRNFDSIDRDTVYVSTGPRRIFELEILPTCPDIDWSRRIVLQRRGGSNFICQGQDADLLVPSLAGGLDRCPVLGVRALSAAEVKAYRTSRRR